MATKGGPGAEQGQGNSGRLLRVFSGTFWGCRNIDVGSWGEDSWPMEPGNTLVGFAQILIITAVRSSGT